MHQEECNSVTIPKKGREVQLNDKKAPSTQKNANGFMDKYHIKASHGSQKLVSETAYRPKQKMLITKDSHFVNWNLVFLEYQRFRDGQLPYL